MSAVALAREHSLRRVTIARRTAAAMARLWTRVDPANIAASWSSLAPAALATLSQGQAAAARMAPGYLDKLVAEFGIDSDQDGTVSPTSLAGIASDGRELRGLLEQPAIRTLRRIKQGVRTERALALGRLELDMITRTQVADAGRAGDMVEVTARLGLGGFIRVLSEPSCSRCVVLAGRSYPWNAGFLRHPRCDCIMLPAPDVGEVASELTNPRAYFDSLSEREQDKRFTRAGAEAIRLGADIAQVVNARKKVYGLKQAGLLATRIGTKRGRGPRLMPEAIFQVTGADRNEAIRLLRSNGYIR